MEIHHHKHILPVFVVSILLACASVLLNGPESTSAGSSHNVRGYAWSSNVGWVSFNSVNSGNNSGYGVNIDSSGNITGHAWINPRDNTGDTDNIGWVSFNPIDLDAAHPPARVDLNTRKISGWAKVLSGIQSSETDGWDGLIHFDGANYGVTLDTNCNWTGYAWGDDVVGWIHFNGTNYGVTMPRTVCDSLFEDPAANLQAKDPATSVWMDDEVTIPINTSTTLKWSSDEVDSCEVRGPSGPPLATGLSGEVPTPSLSADTTFTVLCTGPKGPASDPVLVKVDASGGGDPFDYTLTPQRGSITAIAGGDAITNRMIVDKIGGDTDEEVRITRVQVFQGSSTSISPADISRTLPSAGCTPNNRCNIDGLALRVLNASLSGTFTVVVSGESLPSRIGKITTFTLEVEKPEACFTVQLKPTSQKTMVFILPDRAEQTTVIEVIPASGATGEVELFADLPAGISGSSTFVPNNNISLNTSDERTYRLILNTSQPQKKYDSEITIRGKKKGSSTCDEPEIKIPIFVIDNRPIEEF